MRCNRNAHQSFAPTQTVFALIFLIALIVRFTVAFKHKASSASILLLIARVWPPQPCDMSQIVVRSDTASSSHIPGGLILCNLVLALVWAVSKLRKPRPIAFLTSAFSTLSQNESNQGQCARMTARQRPLTSFIFLSPG